MQQQKTVRGKTLSQAFNTIRLEKEAEREKLTLRKGRIRPRKSRVDCLVQSTFLRQLFSTVCPTLNARRPLHAMAAPG